MIIKIYILLINISVLLSSKPYICLDDDPYELYKFNIDKHDCKLKINGYSAYGSLWIDTNININSKLYRGIKFNCKDKNKIKNNKYNIIFNNKINSYLTDITNDVQYDTSKKKLYVREINKYVNFDNTTTIGCESDDDYGYYIGVINLICNLIYDTNYNKIYINECKEKNNDNAKQKIVKSLKNIVTDINKSTNIYKYYILIGSYNYYLKYYWNVNDTEHTFYNKHLLINDHANYPIIFPYSLENKKIIFDIYSNDLTIYYNDIKFKYRKYHQFLRLLYDNDTISDYLITYPITPDTEKENKSALFDKWFSTITNIVTRNKRDIVDYTFDAEVQFIKDNKYDIENNMSIILCNEMILINKMLNGICNANIYNCLHHILKRRNFKAIIINNILQIKDCRLVDTFDLKLIEHDNCYLFPLINYTINNVANYGFINLETNEIMAESIISNNCNYNRYIEINNNLYIITSKGLIFSNISITYISEYKNITIKKEFDIIDDLSNLREKINFPKLKDVYHNSIEFINNEIISLSGNTKYNNHIGLDIASPFHSLSDYIKQYIVKICIIILSIILLLIIIKVVIKIILKSFAPNNKKTVIELVNLNPK